VLLLNGLLIRKNANCVRESVLLNEVSVGHNTGTINPADLFSKEFKSDVLFHTLRGLLLFYPSSLPSFGVPRLDGGCQSSRVVQESQECDRITET